MRISAKTEYARIAMLELASQYGQGSRSEFGGLPSDTPFRPGSSCRFSAIEGAGLVGSVRGRRRRVSPSKTAQEITLARHGSHRRLVGGGRPDQQLPARFTRCQSSRAGMEAWRPSSVRCLTKSRWPICSNGRRNRMSGRTTFDIKPRPVVASRPADND